MRYWLQRYLWLLLWIGLLIAIGSCLGALSQTESNTWYDNLNRSALTPPGYVFGIAWTCLYTMIGVCGWWLWQEEKNATIDSLKILFVVQLLLNWSWTPLFFYLHLTGFSLLFIVAIIAITFSFVIKAYQQYRVISLLLVPYLLWLCFATYLNAYIWYYN